MADGQKRSLSDAESAKEERPSTKRRKPRNGVTQLAEIRPGTMYQLVAQYGSADDPVFIMQLVLEGKIFKGIGPSKTKAKAMAAEFALLHLGIISSLTESPPDLSDRPYCWDDFTADIFDSNSHIYFDFNHQATVGESDHEAEVCAGHTGEENAEPEGSSESRMIGKNTLTVLMDLHPGSSYKLVAAQVNNVRTKFVMDCYVNGQVFRGVGMSKRLAKARAAKQALQKLDSMEFGTGEDGMPFYEGDEKLWLKYKAELEREAESKLQHEVGDNPTQQLSEYFPDAKFNFPDTFEKPDIADFFVCSISVEGTTYEGSGTSKRDAKNDAAASVLNDLERKGILKQKELEMENKRQEREEKKKAKDGTERKPTAYKSAVAKLNDNFQNIEYKFLSETPLRNTRITAFTVAVGIKGRHYVGVGKNKRMAKLDAAEKVLRDLGMWTEQDEQAKERVKTEEDDLDIVESNQGGWNPGQDQHCWGSGWGQAGNWNSGANQYVGYENNGSWGYGGGYYGGEGVWGQMGVNQGGNFEAIQPMMKEIMGSMFENAFGNNPWKADSGTGVNPAPYGGTDGSGSHWGTNPGTRLGNKSDGSSCGSTAESAMRTPASNSSLSLKSQSGMKSGRPNTDHVIHSKETPEGKSGKLSKYSNFRSAGYDTGFTPSHADQMTASSMVQKQFSQPQPSNYGPYGTPINPSVAGNQNAGFQNFRSVKDSVGSGALTTNTANSQSGLFAKDQRKAPFQNTGIYTAGASGSLQNSSTGSGVYSSYGSTESHLDRGRGGSAGAGGTGMYSDFGNSSYQGYPTASRADGFQAGNSTSSFTVSGGNTPSGYNSSSYSSGGSNFQSSGTNYSYSGAGGNAAVQATSVPATVYQSNQVNYSTNFQTDTGNSATVTSFSGGSFQESAGGTNYMTDGNSGFYGLYGSGFPQQSQVYDFGYNSSGSYNMNTGYELDGCQNTNSAYSYEYSAPSAGTDSYYTNMNRTTW